jgi:isopentenyl-diphosphate delta-isomerase
MGFSTLLTPAFTFIYNEPAGNDLTEHEFDHVFIGNYSSTIVMNPAEVLDYCYMSMKEIEEAIASRPQKYTVWFKIAFPKMQAYLATKKGENEKAAI